MTQMGWRPHRWTVRESAGRFELIKTNLPTSASMSSSSSSAAAASAELGLRRIQFHSISEVEAVLQQGQ
jgi:hypothetical protein